jgi:hypothetical protein
MKKLVNMELIRNKDFYIFQQKWLCGMGINKNGCGAMGFIENARNSWRRKEEKSDDKRY